MIVIVLADEFVTNGLIECKKNLCRAIKVVIKSESLFIESQFPNNLDWESDYDRLLKQLVDNISPCYIFYRFDNKNTFGYEWLFIHWVPENSNVCVA